MRDGNQLTCTGKKTLLENADEVPGVIGYVGLLKDLNVTYLRFQVTFAVVVNCSVVNIFYYKAMDGECNNSTMYVSALSMGEEGKRCFYDVQCKRDTVVCDVALYPACNLVS